MYCSKCGSKLLGENASFCSSCGSAVGRPSMEQPERETDWEYVEKEGKEEPVFDTSYTQSSYSNPKFIQLKSPSGVVKECKVGVSWTQFFFGFFVPFFRGDIRNGLVQIAATFGIALVTGSLAFIAIFVLDLYFMMNYNRMYIHELLNKKGYIPANDYSAEVLIGNGF